MQLQRAKNAANFYSEVVKPVINKVHPVIDTAEAVAREMQSKPEGPSRMNPLNPKKLLLTQWTAVKPVVKQKHFLASRVIQPEQLTTPIKSVEIEAVFSKATQVIAWRGLQDYGVWGQGWV